VPLLGFASVRFGERLLHHRWLALARADFTWSGAPALARRFFADWLVGGLAVGAALGVVLALIVYFVAAARRRAHPPARDPVAAALDAAALRYRGAHPRFRWYARLKYQLDHCYRAIAPLVGERDLTVDLGCGLAMLPVLLGVLGRRALGVEWDAKKAAAGVDAARGLDGIEVVEGDARAFALPPCDVVTLVDVLHYYEAAEQRALLARCAGALNPGGRILVREGDRARGGRARFTRLVERVVTRLGWNRGPRVRFRPVAELRADLEALGLRVRVDEVSGRLHPGNVLLIAERP
jgi:SAM-dependent methyltransferase